MHYLSYNKSRCLTNTRRFSARSGNTILTVNFSTHHLIYDICPSMCCLNSVFTRYRVSWVKTGLIEDKINYENNARCVQYLINRLRVFGENILDRNSLGYFFGRKWIQECETAFRSTTSNVRQRC